MGSKHLKADMVFAWPGAEITVMGADGAINILYGRELKTLKESNPEEASAKRAEILNDYKENFSNPYKAAASGYVDEVILPEETRQRVIASLDMLRNKVSAAPAKKHGNIPL